MVDFIEKKKNKIYENVKKKNLKKKKMKKEQFIISKNALLDNDKGYLTFKLLEGKIFDINLNNKRAKPSKLSNYVYKWDNK